jgi:hypothetical protein
MIRIQDTDLKKSFRIHNTAFSTSLVIYRKVDRLTELVAKIGSETKICTLGPLPAIRHPYTTRTTRNIIFLYSFLVREAKILIVMRVPLHVT